MAFTVTEQLRRLPTFPELQTLAGRHNVYLVGNESAGSFCHPDPKQPKVQGHYTFAQNGDIRGDFTGQVVGKLAGSFVLTTGKAEVTITEKPFLIPETALKSTLTVVLKDFCGKFSTEV